MDGVDFWVGFDWSSRLPNLVTMLLSFVSEAGVLSVVGIAAAVRTVCRVLAMCYFVNFLLGWWNPHEFIDLSRHRYYCLRGTQINRWLLAKVFTNAFAFSWSLINVFLLPFSRTGIFTVRPQSDFASFQNLRWLLLTFTVNFF